jgi:hypothetical protein
MAGLNVPADGLVTPVPAHVPPVGVADKVIIGLLSHTAFWLAIWTLGAAFTTMLLVEVLVQPLLFAV